MTIEEIKDHSVLAEVAMEGDEFIKNAVMSRFMKPDILKVIAKKFNSPAAKRSNAHIPVKNQTVADHNMLKYKVIM